MSNPRYIHWFLMSWLIVNPSHSTVYPLQPLDTEVVGEVRVVYAKKEDTLIDIARNNGLGYDEMVHANPGIDRWAPGQGTPIVLPLRHILPDTPREGIILNIPEMRLYYYPDSGNGIERVVYTYPVSIGRMDWKTPLGTTKVISKEIDPPWKPPASIKAEHANEGDFLPDVVPGGPDNPLGRFAMRLGVHGYLIHGTDKPYGIGMQVTHGCVRMYPEDIEHLFSMVPIGTPVRLIDQPVKIGRLNGEFLLEAHQPLEEDESPVRVTLAQIQKAVISKIGPEMIGIDQAVLQAAVDQISGIPVSISDTLPRLSSTRSMIATRKTLFTDTARYYISAPPPVTTRLIPRKYPITSEIYSSDTKQPYEKPLGGFSLPSAKSINSHSIFQRHSYTGTAAPTDIPAHRLSRQLAPLDTPVYHSSAPTPLPVEVPGSYRLAPVPLRRSYRDSWVTGSRDLPYPQIQSDIEIPIN